MIERVRIVLVSPSGPANVGAVCRAMANMGLRELRIVAPRCDWRSEPAVAYAAHGHGVLDAAVESPTIDAALDGCVKTFATSSKLGLYRRQAAVPPDEAAKLAIETAGSGPVAFAFGPEDRGLLTRELLLFDHVVTIPADPTYPVLNLAAAAMIICYELQRASLAASEQPALPMNIHRELAAEGQKERLFELLFESLERIGFFFGQNPDHLKYALRHVLGRAELSVNEADIFIGLARQIGWYVDHHPRHKDA